MLRLIVCLACLLAGGAAAQTALSPAPVPAWVRPIPMPPIRDGEASGPVQRLLDNEQSRFGASEDEVFVERADRILSPEGLGQMGNISREWDPDTQGFTLHYLHIIRNGQVIDALAGGRKVTVIRRETRLEQAMVDGRLTATIQPEGLQVGDIIDLAYSRQYHDPALHGLSSDTSNMNHPGTAARIYFTASWPASKPIRWRVSPGMGDPVVTTRDGTTEFTLDRRDVAMPKGPNGAPRRYFDLGAAQWSEFRDWAQISALLFPLYDKAATLPAGSPLRRETAKIAALGPDPKTRTLAVLRLAEDQTRYVFLGMNDGGLAPAGADVTWSRRFGDCKGKTVLILALLRALGIEAEPVLVNSTLGDAIPTNLPAPQVFDHVLVRAVIGGRAYWLDGTRQGDRDLAELVTPPYHWGLPLTAAGADLLKMEQAIPNEPLSEQSLSVDASKGIDAAGAVRLDWLLRGDAAAAIRAQVASVPQTDFEQALRQGWARSYPWFNVDTVETAYDPLAHAERLSGVGTGKMEWDHSPEGERFLRLPYSAVGGDVSFNREPGPNRDAPYGVVFPQFTLSRQKISLPPAGRFVLVGADVDQVVGGLELKRRTVIENHVLTVTASVKAVVEEFPADQASAAGATLRELGRNGVSLVYKGDAPLTATTDSLVTADLAAAARGDAAAQYRLAGDYAQGHDVPIDAKAAMAWLQRSADGGYALGQNDLGVLYLTGKAVPVDAARGAALYRKAADQGLASSQFNLGLLYERGQGVPTDMAQAAAWIRKAAVQGLAAAEAALGDMYARGWGLPPDAGEAFVWFKKAADQGDPASENDVGVFYLKGLGATRDPAQAVQWLRKSADHGFAMAEATLGDLYSRGEGVPKNPDQALAWYRKAADKGDARAKAALTKLAPAKPAA
jgi:TPR repeat protein